MRVFKETQWFNQWWLQCLNIGLLIFLGLCIYNWLIAKVPSVNVLVGNSLEQALFISTITLSLVYMYILRLNTFIDEIGIHYQFFPFHFSRKTIRWNEIKECYVRKYSPLKEYGGWGYRIAMGKNGKAFNVKGNKGIQIAFKNDKRLLLGTQMEQNAQEVVERNFKTRNE